MREGGEGGGWVEGTEGVVSGCGGGGVVGGMGVAEFVDGVVVVVFWVHG